MADCCGSVNFKSPDREDNLVLGQSHISCTNMCGLSAYKKGHKLDGEPVSWAEHVVGHASRHYGADPEQIEIKLTAAVEGDDFIYL